MSKPTWTGWLFLILLSASCSQAAEAPAFKLDETRYMPAHQLKRGMKGYGLTVFEGTKPERFEVEIIGVMKNMWGADSDIVLIRCSGKNLEHTGIAAGMSGSPIYVDGKMIGALAYGFPYAKIAIAGVTPIAEMLEILDHPPVDDKATKQAGIIKLEQPLNVMDRDFAEVRLARRSSGVDPTRAGIMELTPIGLPVRLSGLGPPDVAKTLLKMFGPEFEDLGLTPVLGGGTGPGPAEVGDVELVPGSAVSSQMVWGDLNWSGIGTVTEVRDKRVYAYGHQMWGEADVSVPMAVGYIYTFMPGFARTFKIGTGTTIVGAIDTDRKTGIAGNIGAISKSVQARVTIQGWPQKGTKVFRFNTLRHQALTPHFLGLASSAALFQTGGPPEELTARYKITINPEGREPLLIENVESGQDGWAAAARVYLEVRSAVAQLTLNSFERIFPESVDIEVTFEPVRRAAQIETLAVDRTSVRRGETVGVTVELRRWKGDLERKTLRVPIPANAPLGPALLTVCGAIESRNADRTDSPAKFQPKDIDDVLALIQKPYPRDHLYARLTLNRLGVAIDGKELPELPPSMLSLFLSRRQTGVSNVRSTVVISEPSELIPNGIQTVQIMVEEAK